MDLGREAPLLHHRVDSATCERGPSFHDMSLNESLLCHLNLLCPRHRALVDQELVTVKMSIKGGIDPGKSILFHENNVTLNEEP